MIITKSTTPAALRETMSITQSMFRVAAIQMASGPNVSANLQDALWAWDGERLERWEQEARGREPWMGDTER